jgi:tRNA G18 (ribose-2'-O)-methylase SpoU
MYNVRDEYKNNSVEENIAICNKEHLKFSVGCINITGELNIGMMIRSACLLGAENFYIFGRRKFDSRSTVGAENYINIVQYVFDDPIHADMQIYSKIKELYVEKHTIVLCEHGGYELGSAEWKNRLPLITKTSYNSYTPLFLFGSESFGIPDIISENSAFFKVSIPQRGVLRSFNVSAAMAIVCWDYLREMFY